MADLKSHHYELLRDLVSRRAPVPRAELDGRQLRPLRALGLVAESGRPGLTDHRGGAGRRGRAGSEEEREPDPAAPASAERPERAAGADAPDARAPDRPRPGGAPGRESRAGAARARPRRDGRRPLGLPDERGEAVFRKRVLPTADGGPGSEPGLRRARARRPCFAPSRCWRPRFRKVRGARPHRLSGVRGRRPCRVAGVRAEDVGCSRGGRTGPDETRFCLVRSRGDPPGFSAPG
jgi:hypothetical protein